MKLLGNKETWVSLVKSMPQIAVLSGPDGVGRFTGAAKLATLKSGGRHLVIRPLASENVSQVTRWLSTAGPRRIAVIDATGTAPSVWSSLLAPLESVPPNAHVWIVASDVPDAIRTRADEYEFAPLSGDDVKAIVGDMGAVEEEAVKVNLDNVGSVSDAIALRDSLAKASSVRAWMEALHHGSRERLLNAVAGWNRAATDLLVSELESRYLKDEVSVEADLDIDDKELLKALTLLTKNGESSAVAMTAGLAIIESA